MLKEEADAIEEEFSKTFLAGINNNVGKGYVTEELGTGLYYVARAKLRAILAKRIEVSDEEDNSLDGLLEIGDEDEKT